MESPKKDGLSFLREEVATLALTLRRNRRQHRCGVYFRALSMAERRTRQAIDDPAQTAAARAAVLRAALRVRSLLAAGFFLPLATCWFACLARLYVLLRDEAVDANDDVGGVVASDRPEPPSLPRLRSERAADVVYSDSEDDESDNEMPSLFIEDRQGNVAASAMTPAQAAAHDIFNAPAKRQRDDTPHRNKHQRRRFPG